MVFETLNRLKWTEKLSSCYVTILHRGAHEDRMTIKGADIRELKKSYFTYEIKGRESTIPLHRIVSVNIGDKSIWKRRT